MLFLPDHYLRGFVFLRNRYRFYRNQINLNYMIINELHSIRGFRKVQEAIKFIFTQTSLHILYEI